ncbi:MAG: hypothetical protein GTN89_08575 [Acidobacteria bacterium]|nr:hypothetical protein [Acidobacteriota bacterium]NIM63968.1 hypothetical protein [Acidobacteriota bacterium]NIO59373.1 hypothetical protein [Acidobacteriota bacterium]NIQ30409.1 hypothetical protein [Acidobacteriota bacterium]NIQ85335.1 hypothetical protein [Acidobacteriota bacterium]
MPFLIDGDNLLGTWRGRDRGDAAKRKLSFELARFAARVRRRCVVVFDGPSPAGSGFGGETRFSGHGRSADEWILDFLRAETEPRGWLVVTSDRSLADRCRHLAARTERSDLFRKRLHTESSGEKPEPGDDVEYWLEQFGDEDDGAAT